MVPLIVFILAVIMIACEISKPGRSFPTVAGWWSRAALLNILQVVVILVGAYTWDQFLRGWSLFSLESLNPTLGGLLGYLLITFVFYWWHRLRHSSNFLWKWFHQIHHSPQRLEIITAFYKHPFEQIADAILSSIILFAVLGLDATAASYAVLLSGIGELFYHWNVKTPYWLGFFIQRPESHCVHHEDGLHHYNYSDLPVWDMLFGTFRNPRTFDKKCGLGQEEYRLKEMLFGVNVEPREDF